MKSAQKRVLICCVATVALYGQAVAQPLVTGNLTLYYDFDEIVTNAADEKQFLDESGNNFHGTIHEGDEFDLDPGTLTVETDNPWRGAGAANFRQSIEGGADLPVYVDVDGKHITDNFPDRLPDSGLNGLFGLTIAAWLNVTANDVGDQSVFQARTSNAGHGAPHFQLQGNGKLRMTFRDQNGSTIVNAPQLFIDGTEDSGERYPIDEWFHYAGTYDADEGEWAMYYNGVQLATDFTTIFNGLGDWGGQVEEQDNFFAAGFGAVYDSGGRRLDGLMDELYVFNRALTPEEILVLATVVESPPGDCNGDGLVDAADLICVDNIEDRDAVLSALNTLPGDLDGNGDVAFADFLVLSANFGMDGRNYTEGNIGLTGAVAFDDFLVLSANFGKTPGAAAAVPEPSSLSLLGFCCLLLGYRRHRRPRGD